MTTLQRMTYDDLMSLPEDEYLHELVRGEIVRMPPPKGKHGRIEGALAEAVGRFLYEFALARGWRPEQGLLGRDLLVGALGVGEFGIRFTLPDDPDQVRGIDLCYLSPEQVARYEETGPDEYFSEVPVLVAEVISPSETAEYIDEKVNDYLAGGAQLVWLLFPKARRVQVYRPDHTMETVAADGMLDGGEVLPGFSVAVASLFP